MRQTEYAKDICIRFLPQISVDNIMASNVNHSFVLDYYWTVFRYKLQSNVLRPILFSNSVLSICKHHAQMTKSRRPETLSPPIDKHTVHTKTMSPNPEEETHKMTMFPLRETSWTFVEKTFLCNALVIQNNIFEGKVNKITYSSDNTQMRSSTGTWLFLLRLSWDHNFSTIQNKRGV